MARYIIPILFGVLITSHLLLTPYLGRRFRKLQTLDSAKHLKYAVYISFYLPFAFLAIVVLRLTVMTMRIATAEQFSVRHFINFSYISLIALLFFIAWVIRDDLKRYKWFINKSPSTIMASFFFQKQDELLKDQNFDQAKEYLVKICELFPDNVELWCRLGLFNQLFMKNQEQCDRCMDKAKSIIDSAKEPNKIEIAHYESYLGNILCNRGQTEEGLKRLEKAVELDPSPDRIKNYKRKLAELKPQDQPIQD
jgi:tetratricopeptide (TPR) repeat protein